MSFNNQSFAPKAGQGNLSSQFQTPQYTPQSQGTSAPRDIPGRTHRHSSVSSGYSSFPPPGSYQAPPAPQAYGHTPPGPYLHPAYGTSPSQMAVPPTQMPIYGASPTSQQMYGASPASQPIYSTSPYATTATSYPVYSPVQQTIYEQPPMRERSDSAISHKSRRSSHSDKSEKGHKPRNSRAKSPKRPSMADSVLSAFDIVKGAFDSRK